MHRDGGRRSLPGEGSEMREPVCVCGVLLGGTHAGGCRFEGPVEVRHVAAFAEAEAREEPSQVHVASPDMQVNGVVRQRCAWCGALILEHDLANMAVALDPGDDPENPPRPAVWTPGALVRVRGTFPRVSTTIEAAEHPGTEDAPEGAFVIPEDSCMALDAEVTR